ncbi:hypothetical protein [Paenibacillus vini]|uniref:Helix-turn-helix domain-containing protein n=1 Tax=Paenibacillus vini TaxID=1476024 RepID=A0ABQ4MH44_9BACL|nr:hypothetical protein [Paenibacillus vini]GIP55307.1 hypothetical protein J42TS3_43420 [Paenibacillus vini]
MEEKDIVAPQGMINIAELQKRWELSRNIVYSIVVKFKRNIMHDRKLYICLDEIEYYESYELKKKKPVLNGEYVHSSEIKKWLMENGFPSPEATFKKMRDNNLLGKIIKQGIHYLISKPDFEHFKNHYEPFRYLSMNNTPSDYMGLRPKGTMSIRELSVRLKLNSYKSVYKYFDKNLLPKPILFLGTKFVLISDIEAFESNKREATAPKTVEKLIVKLQDQVLNFKHDCPIETTNLYIDFCLLKLKSSAASLRKKNQNVSIYVSTYKRYVSKFIFKLAKLSDSEVELLMRREDISSNRKEILLDFIRYSDSLYNIRRSKNIVISRYEKKKTNSDEKSIYTPELYFEYVNYVKNLDYLIPLSTSSQKVSNAWLFIIMHLTDAWRAPDIVNNLPAIDIEAIGIDSIDWFNDNCISLSQASQIVQQVSKKVEQALSSKTKAILNFFVIPDMVVPFANAAIISELHRRRKNHEFLLSTLSSYRISDFTKRLMFSENQQLMGFQSRKMNRSTLTYLFYSIVEEDGSDADVALELAKVSRSHKSPNSTEIYLNNTNKDGSLNRVSLNIFRRGHFGWLYKHIIDMSVSPLVQKLSNENRTALIENLRSDLKPFEVEGWGEFINAKTKQENSVLSNLTRRTTEDFILLIKKIMAGRLPARTPGGQCLVYPNCKYPLRKNCFGCEYFIPHSSVLTEAADEFKRLYELIKESKYDALLQRDSRFMLHLILLFNEAYQSFDREYVDSFFSYQEFQATLKELIPLLKLKSDIPQK